MAIQTFTSGQVLTAAQMTALQANDYNQTVSAKVASYTLVAADKGTRITMSNAAATTITVNTSLFTAGDSLRIQNIGAGVCTVTAGTATVNSAGPLALVQWAGGQLYFTSASAAVWFPDAVTTTATPGLAFVLAQTVGTGVSSVTVSSAFSATYDTYKIVYSGGNVSGNLNLQMTVGGITTGTYENSYIQGNTRTTALNNVGTGATATFFTLGVGLGLDYEPCLDLNVYNPFLAKYTTISGWSSTIGNGGTQTLVGGLNRTASSLTSFTFTTSTGTLTGGVISVYGYTKA